MILRGAHLAEQHLTLGTRQAPKAAVIEPVVIVSKEDKRPLGGNAQPRELTFEEVRTWLTAQDERTRQACAGLLAAESTHIYESARAEGLKAGEKAALELGSKRIDAEVWVLQALARAAERAFAQEQEQLQGLCAEIVGTALAKIGGPALASKAAALGAAIEVAARVTEGREITIRVARGDVAVLQRFEAELADALPGRKVEIVADTRVELGGCIVETKLGSLDGRFEVQLRELYETLRVAKLASREGE